MRERAKRGKNEKWQFVWFYNFSGKIPSVNSLNPSKTIRIFFKIVCQKNPNFLPIKKNCYVSESDDQMCEVFLIEET